MNIYSTIIFGSLLVTGIASNSPNIVYRTDNSRHFISVQQQVTPQTNSEKECSNNENGPMPGCGRRDI
jgi:hypothetical protein